MRQSERQSGLALEVAQKVNVALEVALVCQSGEYLAVAGKVNVALERQARTVSFHSNDSI